MENEKKELSSDTKRFVIWYQTLEEGMRDFASALMIANLTDEQLEEIKQKTIHNYPLFMLAQKGN